MFFMNKKINFLENLMLKNFVNILPIISCVEYNNEVILNIPSEKLLIVLTLLKKHIGFRYEILSCISGVHILNIQYSFIVVYDLLSISYSNRIRLKIFLPDSAINYSITSIYINGNWWEREIWDLFGIYFIGHPDLRRILTDYGFDGHPMNKNFPLSGFIEVRYNTIEKTILKEPLEFDQEFRNFKYENTWS